MNTSIWFIPRRELLGHMECILSALVESASSFTNQVTFTSVKMRLKPRYAQLRNLHVFNYSILLPKLLDK